MFRRTVFVSSGTASVVVLCRSQLLTFALLTGNDVRFGPRQPQTRCRLVVRLSRLQQQVILAESPPALCSSQWLAQDYFAPELCVRLVSGRALTKEPV